MSKERKCTNAIVITMIVTMRLENKKSRAEGQPPQRASEMFVADNVSVLSGERSRIFTGFGTCKSPFLLFLLQRLRDAEVGDRNLDGLVADGEVRGICSEPFDDDDDEAGFVGVSGVVDRLLHSEPGIKSCSSN